MLLVEVSMGTIRTETGNQTVEWLGWCAQRVLQAATSAMVWLLGIYLRAQSRRHLAGLDDRALRDIGLSRADVVRETDKPFWR